MFTSTKSNTTAALVAGILSVTVKDAIEADISANSTTVRSIAERAGVIPTDLYAWLGADAEADPAETTFPAHNRQIDLALASTLLRGVGKSLAITAQDAVNFTDDYPDGQDGVAYDHTPTGADGTAPYTWAVTDGVVPPGLTFDPTDGQLSGTPTVEDTFVFDVTITDAIGTTDTNTVSIDIAAAV